MFTSPTSALASLPKSALAPVHGLLADVIVRLSSTAKADAVLLRDTDVSGFAPSLGVVCGPRFDNVLQ